ncbi:MAG TPA: hypothetical protein VKB67_10690, partial [Rhizomicrobium sp.]|nr:hypothetical protein [Rhizomicrobium sp.]
MNKPLPPATLVGDGPISRGGYRVAGIHGSQSTGTMVLLAFSGGGKRSAAFGYGVLRGLRDFARQAASAPPGGRVEGCRKARNGPDRDFVGLGV